MESSDDEIVDYEKEYRRFLRSLRNDTYTEIVIEDVEWLCFLLEHVDEFCRVLSESDCVGHVSMGSYGVGSFRFMITEENESAWNKFCRGIKDLCERTNVKHLWLNPFIVGNREFLQVIGGLMKCETFCLTVVLPFFDSREKHELVQTILQYPCERLELTMLSGTTDCTVDKSNWITKDVDATTSRLCRMSRLCKLTLDDLELTPQDCMELSHCLESSSCKVDQICISNCKLPDQGAQQLANSFAKNTSLKRVLLYDVSGNDAWYMGLLSSIPASTSIEELYFAADRSEKDDAFARALFANVCRHNKTVKKLSVRNNLLSSNLFATDKHQDLEDIVKLNHTLEHIAVEGRVHSQPFQPILRLNKAGRRYLAQDGESRSKCIAVLAKVKYDLDCLYFHMRENPILCLTAAAGANSSDAGDNDKKRKAADESSLLERAWKWFGGTGFS